MKSTKLQINFFYLLLIAAAALVVIIFLPYAKPLFLALLFAVLFRPMYRSLHRAFGGKGNIASFLSVIIILVIILIPLTGVGFLMFEEAKDAYLNFLSDKGGVKLAVYAVVGRFQSIANEILPAELVPETSVEKIEEYVGKGYQLVANNLKNIFSSIFRLAIETFIMILGLFFFFRDGSKFKEILISLSPLSDRYDEGIIRKIEIAINSVVKGSILIAVIQGALTSIGFVFFGVPSPVLWGAVAVLAALIPSIGTALVVVPAVIYVFSTSGVVMAAGLALWGGLLVGLVDNLLRPYLIERGIKIHPFLILLSVFGGIIFFGPIGFLLGPITLALLFALIDLYPSVVTHHSISHQTLPLHEEDRHA